MTEPSLIFILAMVTLVAALAFGFWQLRRVRKAQKGEDPVEKRNLNR